MHRNCEFWEYRTYSRNLTERIVRCDKDSHPSPPQQLFALPWSIPRDIANLFSDNRPHFNLFGIRDHKDVGKMCLVLTLVYIYIYIFFFFRIRTINAMPIALFFQIFPRSQISRKTRYVDNF